MPFDIDDRFANIDKSNSADLAEFARGPVGRQSNLRREVAEAFYPPHQGSANGSDPFAIMTGKPLSTIGARPPVVTLMRRRLDCASTGSARSKPAAAKALDRILAKRDWKPTQAPLRLRSNPVWEPASSLLRRLASRNAYSPREFAGAYGLEFEAIRQGDRDEISRLAAVAGVDETMLHHATPRHIGNGSWSFSGERFTKSYILPSRDRVCTACLIDDRAEEPGESRFGVRRRVWWDFAFMQRCPVHGRLLDEERPWNGSSDDGIRSLSSSQDSWEAYVVGRLGFGPRVEADLLDQLRLKVAVDFVATCGTAAAHGPDTQSPIVDVARDAELMRSGFEIARSEEGFRSLLRQRCATVASDREDWSTAEVFGELHARFVLDRRVAAGPVSKLMQRYEAQEKLRRFLQRRLVEEVDEARGKVRGEDRFWTRAAELYLETVSDEIPLLPRPEYGSIPISRALRSKIGPLRIFEVLLDGRLKPRCRVRSLAGTQSIFVSKADLRQVRLPKKPTKTPLTAEEFGRRLGLHVHTVRKLVQHGVVQKTEERIKGSYVIAEEEFALFVEMYVTAMRLDRELDLGSAVIRRVLSERYGIECAVPQAAGLVLFRRSDLIQAGLPAPRMGSD